MNRLATPEVLVGVALRLDLCECIPVGCVRDYLELADEAWTPETVTRPLLLAARRLRRDMTEAGCLLWEHLRAGRFDGWRFRRQHPVDRFVLDFYCPAARLVVELDGAQHHTPDGVARDVERDDWLQRRHGITMLRFDNAQLLRQPDVVLARIRQTLDPR